MNDNQEKMREHRVSGAVVWLIFFGMGVIVFQLLNPSLKLTYDSLDYLAASESLDANPWLSSWFPPLATL